MYIDQKSFRAIYPVNNNCTLLGTCKCDCVYSVDGIKQIPVQGKLIN